MSKRFALGIALVVAALLGCTVVVPVVIGQWEVPVCIYGALAFTALLCWCFSG